MKYVFNEQHFLFKGSKYKMFRKLSQAECKKFQLIPDAVIILI